MRYLTVTFSSKMLSPEVKDLETQDISEPEAVAILTRWDLEGDYQVNCPFESTASILRAKTGLPIPVQRISIRVEPGDEILVASLAKRAPEGVILSEEELLNWPMRWTYIKADFAENEIPDEIPGTIYLVNSFSPAMLDASASGVSIVDITEPQAIDLIKRYQNKIVSSIGHEATAKLMSYLTGINIEMNRITVQAKPGDALIVFNVLGMITKDQVIRSVEELLELGRSWQLILVK